MPSNIFEISSIGQNFLQEINKNFNKKYSRGGRNDEGYISAEEIINLISNSNHQNYYSDLERKIIL